jgi:hypothetical protein
MTEKTAKPIWAKRLFVMFGTPGFLKKLHELGFKTFDHVIDESYDSMLNAQQNEDMQKLAAFLPIYARIAESPTATNATRNFYRWLKANV